MNNILSKDNDFQILGINFKKDKVLAIGYDEKDRPQYIYNKKFTEKMKKKKFLKNF